MMDEGGSTAGETPPRAGSPVGAPNVGASPTQASTGPSLARQAGRWTRWVTWSFTREPAWLLVAAALILALPKAVGLWAGDPIFSMGFFVVPWAIAWTATRTPQAPASAWTRWALFGGTVALLVGGWFYGSTWASVWAIAASLALVHAEQGTVPRGLVPAGLVVLTAPPPLFDRLMVHAQGGVAAASGGVLSLVGLPVTRDAFTLSTPSFTFLVQPQCVGLTTLLATTALVGMVATHAKAPLRRFGAAVLVGVLASLALNLTRVVGVVASSEWLGPLLVDGAFHGGVSMAMGLAAAGIAIPALGLERVLGDDVQDAEEEADEEGSS